MKRKFYVTFLNYSINSQYQSTDNNQADIIFINTGVGAVTINGGLRLAAGGQVAINCNAGECDVTKYYWAFENVSSVQDNSLAIIIKKYY